MGEPAPAGRQRSIAPNLDGAQRHGTIQARRKGETLVEQLRPSLRVVPRQAAPEPPAAANFVDAKEASCPVHLKGQAVPTIDLAPLEIEFERLADEWHAHTDHLSVTWQKELHRAYRYIIGMGEDAVPFILRELKENGGWWFGALEAIARRNAAEGIRDWDEAVRAWERWAQEKGLV